MKSKLLLSMGAAALLFAACTKSDNDGANPGTGNNNSATGNMDYRIQAINPTATVNQRTTAAGVIQWTTATARPTLIRFEAVKGGSEVEFKNSNTAFINLLAPVPVDFGDFTLPTGTYTQVELKIQLNSVGTNPGLELTGTYGISGGSVPVVFRLFESALLKTELQNIAITPNTDFTSITTIDLSQLATDITQADFQNATLTNGTLVISDSTNTDLYETMLRNLRNQEHALEFEQD